MVLTLDKLAQEVAVNVGDRNKERLPEIRRYVEAVVTELTILFRQNSVYDSSTVTITNGEGTLPNDVFAVLQIYDSNSTFYEVVDNTEYQHRNQRTSTQPTAQVFEDVPNWRIKLLNFPTGSVTLTVDYLITSRNPAIIPTYYKDLIVLGAEAKFHRRRSPAEKSDRFHSDYERAKNEFKGMQAYNQGKLSMMKGIPEIELTDPSNSRLVHTQNSFIHIGGLF